MKHKKIYIIEWFNGDAITTDYFIQLKDISTHELNTKAKKYVESEWDIKLNIEDISQVWGIDDKTVLKVSKTIKL